MLNPPLGVCTASVLPLLRLDVHSLHAANFNRIDVKNDGIQQKVTVDVVYDLMDLDDPPVGPSGVIATGSTWGSIWAHCRVR